MVPGIGGDTFFIDYPLRIVRILTPVLNSGVVESDDDTSRRRNQYLRS